MRGWKEDDYLPGATIPLGGTARENKTGSWRTASLPYFRRWVCQACPPPGQGCPSMSEDCSVACQRDCLLCWISCPDGCMVMKDDEIWGIDLDYCKGCGICASVCPRGAITMVNHNENR